MSGETMREAVARAICRAGGLCVGFCHAQRCATARKQHGDEADAAIRTVLERLREPSEVQIEAGATKTWEDGYDRQSSHAANEYVAYEEGLSTLFGDYGEGRAKIYAEEIWQAMLDAAVREVG